MRRALVIAVVLVVGLVVALNVRLRMQQQALEGPSGGSGVIEGIGVDVGTKVAGRIARLAVDRGDRVRRGDVLLEVDCIQERARLAEAEARVEAARAQADAAAAQRQGATRSRGAASAAALAASARVHATATQRESALRELERARSMGSAAPTQQVDLRATQAEGLEYEVEAARAQDRASRAQVGIVAAQIETADAQTRAATSSLAAVEASRDLARVAVDECVVRAPRDGLVEDRYYEEGELVAPGAVVLRIVDLAEVRATFYLPSGERAEAHNGRRAVVVADSLPAERFEGRVINVSSESEFTPRNVQTRTDRDRLVFPVLVTIPNGNEHLLPGMPVQVTLEDGAPAHAAAPDAQPPGSQ